jgi:hypothetical protein
VQQVTDPQGNFTITSDFITSSSSYTGTPVILFDASVVATGAAPSKSNTKEYIQVDAPNSLSRTLGIETTVIEPAIATSTTTISFTPYRSDVFNLSAGQSFSEQFTTNLTFVVTGFPISSTSEVKRTRQFNGIETITVPAGTFSACKFTENGTSTSQGQTTTDETSTLWVMTGDGLPLKAISGSNVTELVSYKF